MPGPSAEPGECQLGITANAQRAKTRGRATLRNVTIGLLAGAHVACVGVATSSKPSSSSLVISVRDHDFDANPKLLSRIQESAHGYFRFINPLFSEQVCRTLEEAVTDAPTVNLHGDAHLEQYAVTDLGRGLTDFDDATSGPAPIDLLRFGVSLSLATRARGWEAHTSALLTRFLDGYRAALRDPETVAPEPAVVGRIRAGFRTDRTAYLRWVKAISGPVEPDLEPELREALKPYFTNMRAESPQLHEAFFRLVDLRRLKLGIGSALDDKFLARIEGPSDDPDDDVVLEIKEVRDLSGVSCVSTNAGQDPFRILVGQSRIAYRPYRFLGSIQLDGRPFWIHAWVDNYQEMELGVTARTPDELAEVVYDVGVQLGRGHPNQIAAPLDRQLRQALLVRLDRHQASFLNAVVKLADEVTGAWTTFTARNRQ